MKKKPTPKKVNALNVAAGLRPLMVPIDSLRPDPDNANEHNAENLAAIKTSLQRYGQLVALVVAEDGRILKGNGTWQAAKELGATAIAALPLPKGLEAHADEFALADNQSARLSNWNPAKLKAALERIKARGTEATVLGFDERALQVLLEKVRPKPTPSNWHDREGAAPKRAKAGELYALGTHRLLIGDSRDKKAVAHLMGKRLAQLCFTDPPYGVDYEDGKGRKIKNDALGRDSLSNFLTDAFKAAVSATTPDAAFYIWHASLTRDDFVHAMKAAGLEERQYIIWAKPSLVLGRADYQWNHEPCFYAAKAGQRPAFYAGRAETTLWRRAARGATETAAVLGPGLILSDGKGSEITITKGAGTKKLRHLRLEGGQPVLVTDAQGQSTVWEVSRDTQQTIHPNQKPVELAVKAIENSTQPGQAVLDLFGGSGSTLQACEQTGRAGFLMELDPRYADGIISRWEKATKGKAQRL